MNRLNHHFVCGLLAFGLIGCNSASKNSKKAATYPDVQVVGAMKNVMWKGELGSTIALDTLSDKSNLYGLGPANQLTGELLVNNGKSYLSKVTSDSTMMVTKTFKVSAPFLVYAQVTDWKEVSLPPKIKSISDLEQFIDTETKEYKRPFAFKLEGKAAKAMIHIQNLPKGSKVSSPNDAHQGQIKYELADMESEIVGFFSTEHKGIFTHHDSFLHMHLITKDESKMGHLDALEIGEMKLFLPIR